MIKLLLPIFLAVALCISSCSRTESRKYRVTGFIDILETPDAVESFKNGDLYAVEIYITDRLDSDPEFKKQYEEIKKREGINFFSAYQTSHYFYKYFYSNRH